MQSKRLAAILLTTACLAGAPSPRAVAQNLAPFRRTQIEALLPQGQEVKAKASRAESQFLSSIARDSRFDYQSFQSKLAQAWSLCEDMERTERNRQKYLSGLLDEKFSEGKISQYERNRRTGIVSKIFKIRMLFIYGSMMPRILDECVIEDGRQTGRLYAGTDWEIVFTQEEMKSLHDEYRNLSGFPLGLLDSKLP